MIGNGSGLQHLLKIPNLTAVYFLPTGWDTRSTFHFNKFSRLPAAPLPAESIPHFVALANANYGRVVEKHRQERANSIWEMIFGSKTPDTSPDKVLADSLWGFQFTPGSGKEIPPSALPLIRGGHEYYFGFDSPALRDAALGN